MANIFLGEPPAAIKTWYIEHYGSQETPDVEDTTEWGKVVFAMESGCSDSNPVTVDGNTFTAGAGISGIKYEIKSGADPVDTTWINLGYNASIPEYVKYRRTVTGGYIRVWVKSTKSDLLADIAVGDQVYKRSYSETILDNEYTASEGETITAVSSDKFTYGNNCTYSVPMTITTSKGEYTFAGYNMTINSQAILLDTSVSDSDVYWDPYFDKTNYRNIWSASPLRNWMNTKGASIDVYRCDSDWVGGDATCNVSLPEKMAHEDGFLKNVAKTINRTWVHSSWDSIAGTRDSNNCEHVSDKFWLLGGGHVENGGKDYLNAEDKKYDTAKFASIYFDDASRTKYVMTSTGAVSGSAGDWWLRSASSNDDCDVGRVNCDGGIDYSGADDYGGVSPAALIG